MIDQNLLAAKQAERDLLGAIILEAAGQPRSNILSSISMIVSPDDFYGDISFERRCYKAMVLCRGPVNEVTVLQHLEGIETTDHKEFALLIVDLPCWMDWESYARAIKDYADKRRGKPMIRVRGGAI